MSRTVVGWTGSYISDLKPVPFTIDRQQALIECIKRRHYNFTHFNHQFMDYCCPVYEDQKICILTKAEFDEVMSKVYSEMSLGNRLMPMDALKREPVNGVLYESKEFEERAREKNGF